MIKTRKFVPPRSSAKNLPRSKKNEKIHSQIADFKKKNSQTKSKYLFRSVNLERMLQNIWLLIDYGYPFPSLCSALPVAGTLFHGIVCPWSPTPHIVHESETKRETVIQRVVIVDKHKSVLLNIIEQFCNLINQCFNLIVHPHGAYMHDAFGRSCAGASDALPLYYAVNFA